MEKKFVYCQVGVTMHLSTHGVLIVLALFPGFYTFVTCSTGILLCEFHSASNEPCKDLGTRFSIVLQASSV